MPDEEEAEICGDEVGCIPPRGFAPSGNDPNELDGIFSSILLLSRRLLSFSRPREGFWSIMSRMERRLLGIPCGEIDVDEVNGVIPKPLLGIMVGGSKVCGGRLESDDGNETG